MRVALLFIIFISIREVKQYERGVRFTFGKFTKLVDRDGDLLFPFFKNGES